MAGRKNEMAKTYRHLWQRMVDPENIEDAIHAAARGKSRRREVMRALADIPATVARIREALERDEWRPPSVRKGRWFSDGIARKKRLLVEPDFDEQIIQHILVDSVIAPIFRPGFFEWSCCSIPGRGQESMAKHVAKKVKRGGRRVKYAATLDIRKCFQSVSVDAVYSAVAEKVSDARVLALVRRILDANTIEVAGETIAGGVPVGLYTSPWFVNILLTSVDRAVKSPRRGESPKAARRSAIYLYVRYIDDMLLMHGNRRELERAMAEIGERIGMYGLELKRKPSTRRFAPDGDKLRFTGFHIHADGRMEVRDRVFLRARRLGAKIRRERASGRRVTAHDAERLISYGGRFRAFGSYNAFPKRVLCGINFALMRRKVAERDRLRQKNRATKGVA